MPASVGARRYDAIVIGGGPAGSTCARHLHRAGLRVVVLDRAIFPRDKVCAGLLHFIGRDFIYPTNPWIRKRIFPGGYTPTLAQVMSGALEPFAFAVLDVENLRPHYALTLRHWLARFDRQTERVASMFDDAFVRAWRLYLAGSRASFTTGWLQLFQLTFARGQGSDVRWTRGC